MKIIAIGKLKSGPLKTLFDEYQKRFSKECSIIELESKIRNDAALSQLKEQDLILETLASSSFILLDERGMNISSIQLAELIQNMPPKDQVFVIGGANGVTPLLRSKAHQIISFGQATWPHMLIRIMLIEQLYRAQQIIKNHPYHRL